MALATAAVLRVMRRTSRRQMAMSAKMTSAAVPAVFRPRRGKICIRKANVSRSISIRSTKFTVMSKMSCLKRESSNSTTRKASESAEDMTGRASRAIQPKTKTPHEKTNARRVSQRDSVATRMASAVRLSVTKVAMAQTRGRGVEAATCMRAFTLFSLCNTRVAASCSQESNGLPDIYRKMAKARPRVGIQTI